MLSKLFPRTAPALAGVTCAACLAAAATPAGAGTLRSSVMAAGGAPGASAQYRSNGTAGQAIPGGRGSSAHYTLYAGFWRQLSIATAVADAPLPGVYRNALLPNAPNPFNPVTVIRYEVGEASPVHIEVYNVQGRLVRSLVHETRKPGRYELVWDGRDDRGMAAGSGVYLSRLRIGSFTSSRKMILTR